MPKKTKKAHAPTEVETFTNEYMQSLNEKFKLRGQLGGLMNQLEELRARNERLADHIKEMENPKPRPPPPPPPPPPRTITIAPTPQKIQPPAAPPPPPPPPPPQTQTIPTRAAQSAPTTTAYTPQPATTPQTSSLPLTKKEMPTKLMEHPPLTIRESPVRIPPTITKETPSETPASSIQSKEHYRDDYNYQDDNINYGTNGYNQNEDDDDVVVVVKKKRPPIETNNAELHDELERLKRKYDRITFYAIIIVFVIFTFMLMKELRLLFIESGQAVAPAHAPRAQAPQYYRRRPEDDGIAGIGDVQFNVRLESKDYPTTPPPSRAFNEDGYSGSARMQQRPPEHSNKITLKPAPPQPPLIQVKCGEMANL